MNCECILDKLYYIVARFSGINNFKNTETKHHLVDHLYYFFVRNLKEWKHFHFPYKRNAILTGQLATLCQQTKTQIR